MRTFTIGTLARQTGVNIETIRYYERAGILPVPARDGGGRRIYADVDTRRLGFIHKCRRLGFSLLEITSLLSLVDSGDFTCKQVHDLTIHHIGQIAEKIEHLSKMEDALREMADQCSGGNVPECPIIESLYEA